MNDKTVEIYIHDDHPVYLGFDHFREFRKAVGYVWQELTQDD